MATWVEDIIQALNNLGGQAPLSQIYDEVQQIRQEPLSANWHSSIRERIEAHSSDSHNFQGKDYFRKVSKGTWALRDSGKEKPQQATSQADIHHVLSGFVMHESFETVSTALQAIKQYRDYSNPSSSSWVGYIQEFFQVIGFGTENIDSRLFFLKNIAGNAAPKAIVGYSMPGENTEEIIPGLRWETYLLFAANYYHLDCGVVTNGLQLKVISYKSGSQQQISFWSDLDGIIKNQKSDSFFPIYKLFALIKQGQSEIPGITKVTAQTMPSKPVKSSGKYAPIQAWLEKQKEIGKTSLQVSFHDLEVLMGESLPDSAHTYRVWWANGGHNQAFAWMNAGWLVKSVDLTADEVCFYLSEIQPEFHKPALSNSSPAGKPYQAFFEDLLIQLKEARPDATQASKTLPENWFSFASGRGGAPFGWALPKEKVLRVELYIDVGDIEKNKAFFDALLKDKYAIEREVGKPLDWDRLDHRRASRISISIPFTLDEPAEKHEAAKQWGVEMMIKYIDAFKPRIKAR